MVSCGVLALLLVFVVILFPLSAGAQTQTMTLSGQVSAWVTSKPDTSFVAQTGLRYIPELALQDSLGRRLAATLDLSANGLLTGSYAPRQRSELDAVTKVYRAWLRLATPTFEARAGLQKINFGSATLFRPLARVNSGKQHAE
jgi:hypothetical protein